MQYKIVIIILLLAFIYTGAIRDYINSPNDVYIKEIQDEIVVNQKDINVFRKENIDDINITENRIKAWNIIITYNEDNHKNIKNKLITSGYQIQHNQKKMFYSLGPFSDLSHAKEESKKLKKLHGLKNEVIDLVF